MKLRKKKMLANVQLSAYLLQTTRFNREEIRELQQIYKALADHKFAHEKYISVNRLKNVLWIWFNMTDESFAVEMVKMIDPTTKNYVTVSGFVKLLSLLIRGTLEEKIKIAFKLYDKYNKTVLTRDIVEEYIMKTIQSNSDESEQIAGEMSSYIFNRLDRDRDGVISFGDYSETVRQWPDFLEVFGKIFPPTDILNAKKHLLL